jgi:hypothetical protein
MIPLVNLMIRIEHDPESTIRQAEIHARHKSACRQIDKHAWFSTIARTLARYLSRMFGSGHDHIEREKACCHK